MCSYDCLQARPVARLQPNWPSGGNNRYRLGPLSTGVDMDSRLGRILKFGGNLGRKAIGISKSNLIKRNKCIWMKNIFLSSFVPYSSGWALKWLPLIPFALVVKLLYRCLIVRRSYFTWSGVSFENRRGMRWGGGTVLEWNGFRHIRHKSDKFLRFFPCIGY